MNHAHFVPSSLGMSPHLEASSSHVRREPPGFSHQPFSLEQSVQERWKCVASSRNIVVKETTGFLEGLTKDRETSAALGAV